MNDVCVLLDNLSADHVMVFAKKSLRLTIQRRHGSNGTRCWLNPQGPLLLKSLLLLLSIRISDIGRDIFPNSANTHWSCSATV